MADRATVALYDSLARWQWWRRKLARARGADGLEIRKRLLPPPSADKADLPRDGTAGLDSWLMQQLGDRPRARLLDLGCGFGASMLRWLGDTREAFGVTPSGYQVRRAREVATSLGVERQCTFLRQPLEADLPQGLDVVLAIEALGHTQALSQVLGSIARALRPGGTLVWLEDLLREPVDADADVLGLAEAWSSPPLRAVSEARRALEAAGLRVLTEVDLTAQVPCRSLEQIKRSQQASSRWQWLPIPFAQRIRRAFAGGFLLERLYARKLACYRLVMAESPEVPK